MLGLDYLSGSDAPLRIANHSNFKRQYCIHLVTILRNPAAAASPPKQFQRLAATCTGVASKNRPGNMEVGLAGRGSPHSAPPSCGCRSRGGLRRPRSWSAGGRGRARPRRLRRSSAWRSPAPSWRRSSPAWSRMRRRTGSPGGWARRRRRLLSASGGRRRLQPRWRPMQ